MVTQLHFPLGGRQNAENEPLESPLWVRSGKEPSQQAVLFQVLAPAGGRDVGWVREDRRSEKETWRG